MHSLYKMHPSYSCNQETTSTATWNRSIPTGRELVATQTNLVATGDANQLQLKPTYWLQLRPTRLLLDANQLQLELPQLQLQGWMRSL